MQIVFSKATWVGKKEDNPDDEPLPWPPWIRDAPDDDAVPFNQGLAATNGAAAARELAATPSKSAGGRKRRRTQGSDSDEHEAGTESEGGAAGQPTPAAARPRRASMQAAKRYETPLPAQTSLHANCDGERGWRLRAADPGGSAATTSIDACYEALRDITARANLIACKP